MNKYIELFKSNFSIITLICYVFGYTYLGLFYYQFDISIFLYISFSDILFTTINYLVFLLLIYVITEFLLYFLGIIIISTYFSFFISQKIYKKLGKSDRVKRFIEYRGDKYYSDNIVATTFTLFMLFSLAVIYLINEKILILSFIFPFILIKTYQLIPKEKGEQQIKLNQFISIIFILILISCFAYWGYSEANNIKVAKSTRELEFKEDNLLFSTKTDSLNFIGETNTYIFLYNKKNRETLIFNKSGISKLKVKDSSLSPEEKKALQKKNQQDIDDFFKKYKGSK